MKKRILTVLLAVCLVLALGTVTALADDGTWEGSGTAESPYEIGTVAELKDLASAVNNGTNYSGKYFVLTNDIDLSGVNWTPIGENGSAFSGTFDGSGYTISNLTINDADLEYAGLFGIINTPATLKNIAIENVNITAEAQVGALAGSAFTGTVENCTVSGDIQITGNYKVGGLAGEGYAKMENCHVIGNVGSSVTGSYAEANFEGDNVGGLVGFRGENECPTINCTVSGISVTGTRKVGGLIGCIFTSNALDGCSVSDVSVASNATNEYAEDNYKTMCIGGLAGIITSSGDDGNISNCIVEDITLTAPDEITTPVRMGYVSGGLRDDTWSGTGYFPVPEDDAFDITNVYTLGTNTGSNVPEDQNNAALGGTSSTLDDDVVARVNGTVYTDLASAINDAGDGDTVEILKECTLTSSVSITKNIVIEGNNNTVTASGAAFYIKDNLESFAVNDLTLKGAEHTGIYSEGNDAGGPWMGIGTYNEYYGVDKLALNNVTIEGFSYGLYFGMNPGTGSNTEPVSIDANNVLIQNCAIKGAYFEKLTESTFADCKFIDNGTNDGVVASNFTSWMCGVDINLKGGDYENIVFDSCTFSGNGDNNGTALHIKARDDNSYSNYPAKLTGVVVTGCTFEGNNSTNSSGEAINPIVLGEPGANNKTPTEIDIQSDVPFTSNLDENESFTVKFEGDFADILPVSVVSKGDEILIPYMNRDGYTFVGWKCDGKMYKAGETVKVSSNMTFTAVWTAVNVPDPNPIEIVNTANGSVKTSLSNASVGSVITITATPDAGYTVGSVVVTGPDGVVDVERVDAATYTFKMPDGSVKVNVTFIKGLPFTDVTAGQWFYEAVSYVYTNGMMQGDSATTFSPNAQMTRAMFWAVLGRIDGAVITGDDWMTAARNWAVGDGVSDGTDPNGIVTREQMVTMLWRYAGEPASDESLAAYSDADSVSSWAETAMSWAIENGIIDGVTATTLVPQGAATRAQCAAIFMRYANI